MKIIGITGTIGAGKEKVAEYLERKGFGHFSARNFLLEEIEKRKIASHERSSMFEVANDLRDQFGPAYIAELLYAKAFATGKDSVLESLRNPGEIDLLQSKPDFILLAVDADPQIRYHRIKERKQETDHVSYEKFLEDERKEMSSDDPHKQNIAECMRRADFVILNNGTLAELYEKLDEVLAKMAH